MQRLTDGHGPVIGHHCEDKDFCAAKQVGEKELEHTTNKRPRGLVQGGRGEGGSGLGTCVHPWWIHVDVWQNQYNIVK